MLKRKNMRYHHLQISKKYFRNTQCLFLIIGLFASILAGCTTQPKPENDFSVTAAVVQLQISEEIFASPTMFKAIIRSAMEEAFQKGTPDIVIFPEYTSVFIALFPYMNSILHSESAEEALMEIRTTHPEITSIQSVFIRQSSYVEQTMQSIFGELANEFNTMIVAGSYFAEGKSVLDLASF